MTPRQLFRSAPKVLLHDHLDGGLRARTVLDLAESCGYDALPGTDPEALARWFAHNATTGSLVSYLTGFRHTHAVMRTAESLHRVAAECVEDLADDGVVYAEVRFAPDLHLGDTLLPHDVVETVLAGFADGQRRAAGRGQRIRMAALLVGNRQADSCMATARLAVRYRDSGVVGFDIAGPEHGHPPARHRDTFAYLRRNDLPYTIHAGEAHGLPSIRQAVEDCHAHRLGHGTRLVDDITGEPGARVLGPLASRVRDEEIALEMCPTSNVQTGAAASLDTHPIELLRRLSFPVTVNTDNRLLAGHTLTDEVCRLADTFGWTLVDLAALTRTAINAAFVDKSERDTLLRTVIEPGFAALRQAAMHPDAAGE